MKNDRISILISILVGIFFTVLWGASSQAIREETGAKLAVIIILLLLSGGGMGFVTYKILRSAQKED